MQTDIPDLAASRPVKIQAVVFPQPPLGEQNERVGNRILLMKLLRKDCQKKVSERFKDNGFGLLGKDREGKKRILKEQEVFEILGFQSNHKSSEAIGGRHLFVTGWRVSKRPC
ncbi:hypothetical protein [Ruegeria arenilitoris]|uniref:hypothetical protein n=1 Tax=Ruegeria arenilitoris TaxID=1173585 RepID=UPI00147E2AB4|nr:hypothetical protein [Ruegeria arenilitoris]